MMKRSFVLAACILPLLAGNAAGQANIVPDPLPRLPPQPGQGLPLEDLRFLEQGTDQSAIQIEIGELAAERASDEALSQLGSQVATDHEQIRQKLTELAQRRGVEVSARTPDEAWRGTIDQLQGQSGEDFDRAFLDVQLKIGRQLVELYQTQASNSTDTGLASFAITTLVQLQQHFAIAQQLAAQYGLSPDTVEQPPQY
jgi:predicted outer membrane protein